MLLQDAHVVFTGVLHSSVGVMHQPGQRLALRDGLRKCSRSRYWLA